MLDTGRQPEVSDYGMKTDSGKFQAKDRERTAGSYKLQESIRWMECRNVSFLPAGISVPNRLGILFPTAGIPVPNRLGILFPTAGNVCTDDR